MVAGETLLLHKSVLVNEVLAYLEPAPGKVYLDVTFGSGGHTRAILEHEPRCKVIAMDWDMRSLDTYGPALQEEFPDRLTLLWGNFGSLYKLLKKEGIRELDGILADFGTSQMHIIERPGFSVYRDTPLDMRMSPPHQTVTAQQIVNQASEEELREIFWQFGQEKYTKQIAYAIVQDRKKKKFTTTAQLARLIERVVPKDKRKRIHPATRIFQALRMCVNKELENISSFLSSVMKVLKPEGRVVCISFHSLEDRLVKQFFADRAREGTLVLLTPKVVIPSDEEVKNNPSSRSAKLRAAQIPRK